MSRLWECICRRNTGKWRDSSNWIERRLFMRIKRFSSRRRHRRREFRITAVQRLRDIFYLLNNA